jgi:hypothetical protein
MSNFDDETAVEAIGDGRWRARISAEWSIGDVPNGGYVQAVALAAIRRSVPHPHPLTVTTHFLRPCAMNADAVVEVEPIRSGRTVSTASARLVQDGKERLRVLATYGDLAAGVGPSAVSGQAPSLGSPDTYAGRTETGLLPGAAGPRPTIAGRIDVRLDPAWVAGMGTPGGGTTAFKAWIRFSDGRPSDAQSLPLLVDALPPAIFGVVAPEWVPTIELTTHVRALPAPGWLRAVVSTRFLVDGLFDEECELWDADDRLVAMSRQLARVLSPPKESVAAART